jgi:protein required for attachment to host cells
MEHRQMTSDQTPDPHNALVLIGDGQSALLRNKGTTRQVSFEVEADLEQDNPATREQGTDRPGRSISSVGAARSAVEEADWHHIAKERFAGKIAEALYRHAHRNASINSWWWPRQRSWAIFGEPFMPK